MNECGVWKPFLLLAVLLAIPGSIVAQSPGQDPRGRGPDENPQFFPTEVFGSNRSIVAMGYSWYLRSMQEKPLAESRRPQYPQVYRLLAEVRPYNAPVVVRLSARTDGSGELVTKAGRDGGHPDILTVNTTAEVSQVDVQRFLSLLENADFWSMPTQKLPDTHKPVVMGEGGWMLEGMRDGTYHLVYRGTSGLGPLKDPLIFLLVSLGKVDFRSLPVGPQADR